MLKKLPFLEYVETVIGAKKKCINSSYVENGPKNTCAKFGAKMFVQA